MTLLRPAPAGGAERYLRWLAAPLSGVLGFVLLLGAVSWAGGMGPLGRSGGLPSVVSLDYGPQMIDPVAPLEEEFVREALGDELIDELSGDAEPRSGSADDAAPGEGAGSAPGPQEDGFAPREGGEIPQSEEFLNRPDLRIELSVSDTSAHRGDTLEYLMTVTNTGDGPAKNVELSSHVPEHTTLVASPQCGGDAVTVEPGKGPGGAPATCVDAPVALFAPGEHEIVVPVDVLPEGRRETYSFRVTVNANTPRGAEIRNHAHADALNVPKQTSNETVTVVQ